MYLHFKISLDNFQNSPQSRGPPGLSAKIIHGKKAEFGQFPWHVSLLTQKNSNWFSCGGSLISKTVVLTAAHCLYRYYPWF